MIAHVAGVPSRNVDARIAWAGAAFVGMRAMFGTSPRASAREKTVEKINKNADRESAITHPRSCLRRSGSRASGAAREGAKHRLAPVTRWPRTAPDAVAGVEKKYAFDGRRHGELLDLFDGRRQLIVYRAFFEPGVSAGRTCVRRLLDGCRPVAHVAHLNAATPARVRLARSPTDIERLKATWAGRCRGTR